MELTERIDVRLAALEAGIGRVWSQRRVDKREAKVDAETRHKELLSAIRNVNGTVRTHGERLVRVETRCDANHTQVQKVTSGEFDLTGGASKQRMAAQIGGYAGGTVAALYIVWQIIVRVIEAIQAAQVAGGV